MLHIQLKGLNIEHHWKQILGPKGWSQKVIFSTSGNAAYQIKVKGVYTNMQAKPLTFHTPLISWIGLKGQILILCRKYLF